MYRRFTSKPIALKRLSLLFFFLSLFGLRQVSAQAPSDTLLVDTLCFFDGHQSYYNVQWTEFSYDQGEVDGFYSHEEESHKAPMALVCSGIYPKWKWRNEYDSAELARLEAKYPQSGYADTSEWKQDFPTQRFQDTIAFYRAYPYTAQRFFAVLDQYRQLAEEQGLQMRAMLSTYPNGYCSYEDLELMSQEDLLLHLSQNRYALLTLSYSKEGKDWNLSQLSLYWNDRLKDVGTNFWYPILFIN